MWDALLEDLSPCIVSLCRIFVGRLCPVLPRARYGTGSFGDNSTHVGMVDAILAKLDASGNLLWSHQFGTTDDDYAESVAVRHNRIYVVGNTRSVMPGQESAGWADGFIKAFDISGNEAWTIQFGSNMDDHPRVVKTSQVGHVVVAGHTWGGFTPESLLELPTCSS